VDFNGDIENLKNSLNSISNKVGMMAMDLLKKTDIGESEIKKIKGIFDGNDTQTKVDELNKVIKDLHNANKD